MLAVSCVALTKLVVLVAPPHLTVEIPEIKFVPLTVNVKAPPPAIEVVGEMVVIVGVETVIVNV